MHDPPLRARAHGAAKLLTDAHPGPMLRHVRGRRIAVRVECADGPAVLKVFASPRARGIARRLRWLRDSSAQPVVPALRGVDWAGHVLLTEWVEGTPLHEVDETAFVAGCAAAGRALRRLHDSDVRLDRTWTSGDEVAHLERTLPASLGHMLPAARGLVHALANDRLVPAHRDFHPKQVVVDGAARLIDLDDAAQAPAALDVGNFLAHLRADAALGVRSPKATQVARREFLDEYGPLHGEVEQWEWLALVRLAGLAITRRLGTETADTLARVTMAVAA